MFTPEKKSCKGKLDVLLKALLKNGLKISSEKCQLFKKTLQYIGNTIFIKGKTVCIKPMRMRIEAIKRLMPPTTPKGCRSLAGVVNFLTFFCSGLQKVLKPTSDLMLCMAVLGVSES